jgi:tRNA threonylcarbamoyladenosine biosynthesis protein TsaB
VKLLALDTATACCSAALLLEDRLLSRSRLLQRGHAEHILLMIDELLRTGSVTLAELDAVAFGRGPGAFTGLRLAASVAQGLAFGAGLPVVPVSDLRAVAQQAFAAADCLERVLVCTDARMQEVYWACFERSPQGLARAVGEEHLSSADAVTLPPTWDALDPGGSCGAGSGFGAYPQLGARLGRQLGTLQGDLLPRAEEIARLGAVEVAAGRVVPAEQAVPVYLRDDVAQPQASQPSD